MDKSAVLVPRSKTSLSDLGGFCCNMFEKHTSYAKDPADDSSILSKK